MDGVITAEDILDGIDEIAEFAADARMLRRGRRRTRGKTSKQYSDQERRLQRATLGFGEKRKKGQMTRTNSDRYWRAVENRIQGEMMSGRRPWPIDLDWG